MTYVNNTFVVAVKTGPGFWISFVTLTSLSWMLRPRNFPGAETFSSNHDVTCSRAEAISDWRMALCHHQSWGGNPIDREFCSLVAERQLQRFVSADKLHGQNVHSQ